MNQILSVEPPKPKKEKRQKNNMRSSGGGTIEIEKIVRFFAIVLIVFGIIMIASGSYSMYQGTQTGNSQAKPTISVQEVSETQLELEVSHSTPLQRVTYSWNNDEQVELDASGKRSVTQTIEIPTGDNTLNVYAVDQDGRETNYSRMYTREGDISIDFAVDGSNLKVTASGKNQLSYMTYRWDEEEEQRIDINNMDVEYSIEIPMGQHTLTVSVVDVNNTMETKEQEVKGVTKPTVEISLDDSKSFFVVKASDDEGITRVEVTIDEDENQKYLFNLEQAYPIEERKQFEYGQFALHDGENKIEVTVYNESGVSETAAAMLNK